MSETPREPSTAPHRAGTEDYEIERLVQAPGEGAASPECRLEIASEPLPPRGRRICLIGEIDMAVAETVKQRLTEEIDSNDTLLIDLSEVSFIDSTGLAVLIAATRHAQTSGTELRLGQSLSPEVRRLFEIAGALAQFGLDSSPR